MTLYIDPGTGSMLFAILIGVLGVLRFALKGLFIKLRFFLSGGKKADANQDRAPLVVFSEGKRYWSVFEPVCRELDSRGFDTVYMTASPDDPALDNPYPHLHTEFIGEGNKAFAVLNFLKASVLLSTTPGLDVYQWKRSKEVDCYVHMLHGPNEVLGYRAFGLDYYDAILLSGEYQERDIRKLEELRGLPAKELEIVGIPYLDEMAKRLAAAPSLPEHPRTVLLAPTWGKSAIFSRFGSKVIDSLLETGYHIILRPHPQSFLSEKEEMEKLMKAYPDSEQLEWNRDADNFEVLRRSDVMISDYSGVMFEFALVFDKPVICTDTEPDLGPYDAWWVDTPFWTSTAIPRIGPVLSQAELPNLKALIDRAIEESSYRQSREEVRNETWMYRGEGAKRAADALIRMVRERRDKQEA